MFSVYSQSFTTYKNLNPFFILNIIPNNSEGSEHFSHVPDTKRKNFNFFIMRNYAIDGCMRYSRISIFLRVFIRNTLNFIISYFCIN